MKRIELQTGERAQFIDITERIQAAVEDSGIKRGLCHVFVPHTTAGITINENADPDVKRDILMQLERIVPRLGGYHHREGNSAAHIKASLTGFSSTLFIEGGNLLLGTWQAVYFCEFDGPKRREVFVEFQATDGR